MPLYRLESLPSVVSSVASPSDVSHIKTPTELAERVLSVIELWNDKINPSLIPLLLNDLANRMFANPKDEILVMAMNKVAKLSCVPQYCKSLLDMVASKLQATFAQDSAPAQLLFDRLSPLLILRTLPMTCFHSSTELFEIVKRQLLMQNQFDDIKRLCAELIAKFPLSQFLSFSLSQFQAHLQQNDYEQAKVFLFILCNAFQLHGKLLLQENVHITLLPLILSVFGKQDKKLEKIQMGCMDTLALVIKCVLSSYYVNESKAVEPATHVSNVVEEVASTQVDTTFIPFITQTMLPLVASNQDCTISICIIHSFTISLKHMEMKHVILLASISLRLACTWANKDISIWTSALQYLLHLCFHLKSAIHPYCVDLLQLVKQSLAFTKDASIRLAACKLLSAILVARDDIIIDYELLFLDVQKQLTSLSTMDSNIQVRQLAQQLITMLTTTQ